MTPRSALLVALLLAPWPQPAAAAAPPDPRAEVQARRAELDAVTRDIAVTAGRQAELRREIESLDQDRATLNQALLDAGKEVQRLEGEIDASERRLSAMLAEEDELRASLAARRDVLADVLAALQRMGNRPPPPILVRPQDALSAVRSAMLLGAVVPHLREVAGALADDLERLVALRTDQERERDRLRADAAALAEGRARTALLLESKRAEQDATRQALSDAETRASSLAAQATSLRDLVQRLEADLGEQKGAGGLARPDRLAPAIAFANAKGLLPMPANGQPVTGFGEDNGLGGRAQGISLATRAGAQVSSPADGTVAYAGPFRSYGQLLIINAGDGYHVILAGMERIDVQVGQFVLAGEPVAVMASQRLASVGATPVGTSEPVLYIEFRQDGASIDPAPWWAASNAEKVGG
jgi:septal ring factor EnvC (AmiA/AmiB activator)